MHRFFISSAQSDGRVLSVTGEDVNHIRNVLRMRIGEDLEAVDENGLVSTCRITALDKETVTAEVLFTEMSGAELPSPLTLYMGLPKFEKMELIIQKAVELGASRIVPVKTARTVVKLDEKKAAAKQVRWQAIAEAAAKQSKRTVIPEVAPVMTYKEALREASEISLADPGHPGQVFIPYEKAEGVEASRALIRGLKTGSPVSVFIGPEGGFEEKEVELALEAGAKTLTLGPRILRCETAAITVLSLIMFELT